MADVHGSVSKQPKVSDVVWSRAWCSYRPSGMSRQPMVLAVGKKKEEKLSRGHLGAQGPRGSS